MSADYWRRWPAPLTFLEPGDEAVGEVVGLGAPTEKWPELHLRQADGIIRVVRVTQARLHELLTEAVPCVGDRVRIRFTGLGKAMPGMSAPKEFTVEVRRKGSQPPISPKSTTGEVLNATPPGAGK